MSAHTAASGVLWAIGILVVLLYALIPVAWIASLSFKTPDEVGDRKFFSGFSFENYDAVFSDDTFIAALINSIGIAVDRHVHLDRARRDGRLRHLARSTSRARR